MIPRLQAADVSRSFAGTLAVDGISFDLNSGEFLSIFGPNGAGKTTLLKILAGVIRADEGQVSIDQKAVEASDRSWRSQIGIVTHQTMLYDQLSGRENLLFYAKLFDIEDPEDRIRESMITLDVLEQADRLVGSLSRGFQQRLALARALLHNPKVLLLDEPYAGLDLYASRLLRDRMSSLKDGNRTVVLVTHSFEQGLELADRIAIQAKGRFVFTGSNEGFHLTEFEQLYWDTLQECGF
jgi:heme exporter protein A